MNGTQLSIFQVGEDLPLFQSAQDWQQELDLADEMGLDIDDYTAAAPSPEPFPGRDWSEFEGAGEEYQDLARAVAYHMGAGWTYHDPPIHYREGEPMPSRADIDGPDGCGVCITKDWDSRNGAPRVSVYGTWPEDVKGIDDRPVSFSPSHHDPDHPGSITCATSRGPEAIARDIERRYLPKYLPVFERMVERREARIARLDQTRQAYQTLAEADPFAQFSPHAGRLNLGSHIKGTPNGTVELSVFGDKLDGHLDVREVPVDKLLRIVRILAE